MSATDLADRLARDEIASRRLRLRIPFEARDVLSASLAALRGSAGGRAWGLPDSTFRAEVKNFRRQQKGIGAKRQEPRLRSALPKHTAESMSGRIDGALMFLERAEREGLTNRPIDVYYSCATLCEVYSRLFFTWGTKERKGHGVSCSHQNMPRDVGQTVVKIQPQGTLPRLETVVFLVGGWPTCFSELVTYSERPTIQTGPGELLEKFCNIKAGSPITQLTLAELHAFDYAVSLRAVRQRHGFHKFSGLIPTAFLLDYLTLFVASSLARYDTPGWQEVMAGRSNPYRRMFEEAFRRYSSFTADAILLAIEKPLEGFKPRLVPSEPNPFSHDHRRFGGGDPNNA